ncbi:MAG: DUF6596 domain-containing protein, partial [Planctomycetota bacterium]
RHNGAPDDPAAWLQCAAKNRIIDVVRRERRRQPWEDSHGQSLSSESSGDAFLVEPDEVQDSVLRMIFICCHPSLSRTSQLALTLRLVCGFGQGEIASALLQSPEAIKKRITRAKQSLQLNDISLQLPAAELLHERLDAVHDVLYLMFSEGHCASQGEVQIDIDLCEEAARLCHLLCNSPTQVPATSALLSLMLFHAARLESRTDDAQATILLDEQDRDLWDRDMIRVAEYWLARSTTGDDVSRFHLEAGIARLHCNSPSIDETDWMAILRHYDLLIHLYPSPLYGLSRSVILGRMDRHDEAQTQLAAVQNDLKRYALADCVAADLATRRGDTSAAQRYLRFALEKNISPHQRTLIQHRLESLHK